MDLKVGVADVPFGADIARIEVPAKLLLRIPTGNDIMDAALGGRGMTPSVTTLFTGTPGAGKTTMCLSVAAAAGRNGCCVVYNSAEESIYQVKMVYDRLRLHGSFGFGGETSVPKMLERFDNLHAKSGNKDKHPVLIVDSLQAMHDGMFSSGRITTATAERALEQITSWAKGSYANVFVIGHVTKAGKAAGTQKLRHMVDTHLMMSIDTDDRSEFYGCRKLKVLKNRFGANSAVIFLRMEEDGFVEIARRDGEEDE